MKRFFLASAALLLALPLFAQETQKPVQEKIEVNAVLVDATVTDRTGAQILGLDKDDFVVKENGVEQQIASVDYFTNRRLLTSPEDQAKFKAERIRSDRYFIIFFDKLGENPAFPDFRSRLMRAKVAADNFVDHEIMPGDRVAVAGYDVRLKVFSDFTTDRKALHAALDDAMRFSNGITKAGSGSTILANVNLDEMMNRTGTVYDGIRVLADATRAINAKKALIVFTGGIGEPSATNPNFAENDDHWYKPMIRAVNAANIAIYPVNLRENSMNDPTEQALSRMADESGGEYYRNLVNFATPLKKIENENNGYYLITYYTKPAEGHGFRKIEVRTKNPEFRVKAREGYAY